MEPSPPVVPIRELGYALRPATTFLLGQAFLILGVLLCGNSESVAVRTPGQILDAEAEIGDLAGLATIDGHYPYLSNRLLEVGGAKEGETSTVRCPSGHRVNRPSSKGRVAEVVMHMDLAPIRVLFGVKSADNEGHSHPIGVNLGVGGNGEKGEILRLHGWPLWRQADVYAAAVARLLASFFGSGLVLGRMRGSDAGSGTIASLLALGISFLLQPVWGRLAAFAITFAFGYWAVNHFRFEHDDPGWVVVDEAAGLFLATIGLGLTGVLVGFVVFRIADIGKNLAPGVAGAERLPGALGIMVDDVVAGIYGLSAGWIAQVIFA